MPIRRYNDLLKMKKSIVELFRKTCLGSGLVCVTMTIGAIMDKQSESTGIINSKRILATLTCYAGGLYAIKNMLILRSTITKYKKCCYYKYVTMGLLQIIMCIFLTII